MSEKPPRIIVVSGIQAAGKSTVARLLAQRGWRAVGDLSEELIQSHPTREHFWLVRHCHELVC